MDVFLKAAILASIWGSLVATPTYYMDSYCGKTIDFALWGLDDMRLKLSSSSYLRSMDCQLTLKTRSNTYLMLYFNDFQIDCSDGWLDVFDGQNKYDRYVDGLSGHQCGYRESSTVYTTSGEYLTLHVVSNVDFSQSGFEMILTPYHRGSCYSNEYRCDNGRCISKHARCHGYNQCGDYSDCPWLAVGVIAGIVVGSVIMFTICVVVVVVCCRRRRHTYQHIVVPQRGGYGTTGVGYNQPVPPPYPQGQATSTYQ